MKKQVWAKYPKTEQEIAYDQIVSKINSANEEYIKLMEKAKEQIVKDLMAKYKITEDMRRDVSYNYVQFETRGCDLRLSSQKAESERRRLASQKVEDIIVTLELGGTKADLEKMLSEI